MITSGADNTALLSKRSCEKAAELRELQGLHPSGEIFTETAELFRLSKLADNPWCIRFPTAGGGFIFLKDNHALHQYLSAYPQGGRAKGKGHQMLESQGEPYATVKSEDATKQPSPKSYGALVLRQVFILQECPSQIPAHHEC